MLAGYHPYILVILHVRWLSPHAGGARRGALRCQGPTPRRPARLQPEPEPVKETEPAPLPTVEPEISLGKGKGKGESNAAKS